MAKAERRSISRETLLPKNDFSFNPEEFDRMPVDIQLIESFKATINPKVTDEVKREMRSRAIMHALETSSEERERVGIHLVAVGPLDNDANVSTFTPISLYSIYAVFPFQDKKHFVSTFNSLLKPTDKQRDPLDTVVNNSVDEVREETGFERYNRLMFEIKGIDTEIFKIKNADKNVPPRETNLTEPELNRLKSRRVLEYLQTATELSEEFPRLNSSLINATSNPTEDDDYFTVKLQRTKDKKIKKRLLNPDVSASLSDDKVVYSTRLNIDRLRKEYRRYVENPLHASEQAETSAGICRLIGITPKEESEDYDVVDVLKPNDTPQVKRERKRTRAGLHLEKTDISAEPDVVPKEKNIFPPQTSMPETKRQKRLKRKKSNSSGMKMVSFAELQAKLQSPTDSYPVPQNEFSEQEQIQKPPIENAETQSSLSPGTLIRTFLELDPIERADLGVRIITVGQQHTEGALQIDHPEISQYAVYLLFPNQNGVEFLHAHRSELISNSQPKNEEFIAVDNLVKTTTEIQPESICDSYNRLVSEVQLVDSLLTEHRAREQLGYANSEDKDLLNSARAEIKELTGIKKSLLESYLATAQKLKQTYPYIPLLWLPQEDSSESYAHLALFNVRESDKIVSLTDPTVNAVPDGVLFPPVYTKIHLKSAQQRKRLAPGDVDVRLAGFLAEELTPYRLTQETEAGPELKEFINLSLPDMFKRAYEAKRRGQAGELDREVATTMQRIAMKTALQTSKAERAKHGIEILSIGPRDAAGKLLVEDQEFSQYLVFVTFPWRDNKKFFEESRRHLAKDPLRTSLASLNELQGLDKLVRKETRLLDERLEDKNNRLVYEISTIESQIKVLFDQKSPDNSTNANIENVIDQLQKRKLPLVAQYLTVANSLQQHNKAVGKLYAFSSDNADIKSLRMKSVIDRNIRERLLNNEEKSILESTVHPFETRINFHRLQQYAASFDEGDKSSVNQAAVMILETLGMKREGNTRLKPQSTLEAASQLLFVPDNRQDSLEKSLQEFQFLSLEEMLAKVYEDGQKSYRKEVDSKLVLTEERLTIRSALTSSQEERDRLGIRIFALGSLDSEGNLQIKDPTSQYALHFLYPTEGRMIQYYTSRSTIATDPYKDGLPLFEDLEYWDTIINSEAELWEEGEFNAYNRHIEEIKYVDRLLKISSPGDTRESLSEKKLSLLSSYLLLSHELSAYFSSGDLYGWEDLGAGARFQLYPVVDANIVRILLQETEQSYMEIKKNPTRITISYDEIWRRKLAFNDGDESEANRSAAAICDILGMQAN